MKKTIKDIDVSGKRVLVRTDLNVPLMAGRVLDDARLRAALPTIQYLIQHRARIILVSHLGRPDGFVVESLRMNPVADRLANLLQRPVTKVNNSIGPEVQEAVKSLEPGQILLLENIRFHPGEIVNDQHFSARLASIAELFVSDAFASAHRPHASTTGVARYLPAVAGLLMESEIDGLDRIHQTIRKPVVVLMGGESLVDKAGFIEYCLGLAKTSRERMSLIPGAKILFGGILANTLLRAKGLETGHSEVEMRSIGIARDILRLGRRQIEIPSDVIAADALSPRAHQRVIPVDQVPPSGYIVDIGPETIEQYLSVMDGAGTIIWNGPMGVTEFSPFAQASLEIAKKMASLQNIVTIAGGGETTAALDSAGVASQINYLSTGGAAFLAALQGERLPGIEVLEDAQEEKVRGGG